MAWHGFTEAKKAEHVFWTAEGLRFTAIQHSFIKNIECQHQRILAFPDGMTIISPVVDIQTFMEMVSHR